METMENVSTDNSATSFCSLHNVWAGCKQSISVREKISSEGSTGVAGQDFIFLMIFKIYFMLFTK